MTLLRLSRRSCVFRYWRHCDTPSAMLSSAGIALARSKTDRWTGRAGVPLPPRRTPFIFIVIAVASVCHSVVVVLAKLLSVNAARLLAPPRRPLVHRPPPPPPCPLIRQTVPALTDY